MKNTILLFALCTMSPLMGMQDPAVQISVPRKVSVVPATMKQFLRAPNTRFAFGAAMVTAIFTAGSRRVAKTPYTQEEFRNFAYMTSGR